MRAARQFVRQPVSDFPIIGESPENQRNSLPALPRTMTFGAEQAAFGIPCGTRSGSTFTAAIAQMTPVEEFR